MRFEDYLVNVGLKKQYEIDQFQVNYDLANELNKNKPYIKQIAKDFVPKSKISSEEDRLIDGRKIEKCGCVFDVIDGTITKQFTDFNILCMVENIVIDRLYNSNNLITGLQRRKTKGIGLFGIGWALTLEIYCNYTSSNIEICYIDGTFEKFSKENGKWINKDIRSLSKIIEEDLKKSEIFLEKQDLIYIFSFDGRLKGIQDKNKNSFEIRYIPDTYLINEILSSCGRKLMFTYKDNKISTIKDNINRVVKYFYETDYLVMVEQSNGGKYKFSYDEKHRKLNQIVDPNGNIEFKTEYDRYGKSINLYESKELSFELKYDERAKELHFISSNNTENIVYKHDRTNLVKEIRYGNGDFKKFEYDSYGNMVSKTNSEDEKIEYSYNQYNQLIYKNSDESHIGYSYGEDGMISKIVNSNGYEKIFFYDRYKNLVEVREKIYKGFISAVSYEYDARGRIIEKVDANKSITKMFYKDDNSVLPDKITYPNGFAIEKRYDQVGRPIAEIQNDKITEYKYNNMDLVIQTKFPDSNHDFKRYDLLGNLKEVILPKEVKLSEESHKTPKKFNYFYDEKNRLLKIASPMGDCIDFSGVGEYGVEEKISGDLESSGSLEIMETLKAIEVLETLETLETLDYVGNLLERRIPLMKNENDEILYRFEKFIYDKNFNLIEKKIGCEYVTADELPVSYAIYKYTYDDRNNMVNIHKGTGGNTAYYYRYGDTLAKETVKVNENKNCVVTFEYDDIGLLTKKIEHMDIEDADLENIDIDISELSSIKIETKFDYDENGNLIQITLPDGSIRNFEYNDDGKHVTQELHGLKQHAKEKIAGYKYNVVGDVLEIYDNNGTTTFIYDKYHRILKTIYSNDEFDILAYDFADNIISFTDRNGNITKHVYNSLNKLGTITHPDGSMEKHLYGLDGNVSRVIKI